MSRTSEQVVESISELCSRPLLACLPFDIDDNFILLCVDLRWDLVETESDEDKSLADLLGENSPSLVLRVSLS